MWFQVIRKIILALLAVAVLAGLAMTAGSRADAATSLPYGVTLSGLQSGMSTTQLEAEISAVHDFWNSNTVRLQVEQDKLVWKSGNCPINTDPVCGPYKAQIQTVVNYALGLGLNVVINDQTEEAPNYTANEPLPTHATTVFWQNIAPLWGGNANVAYDLFNEPRIGGTGSAAWDIWRNGGTASDGNSYTGMQFELQTVRNSGNNPVWAEGLDAGGTLNGIVDHSPSNVGTHQLSDPDHLLNYSFHHPMNTGSGFNSTSWFDDFGYLAKMAGYRVSDGEFNNSVDGTQYCLSNFPSVWDGYNAYLAGKSVGMTVWTIGPVGTVNGIAQTAINAVPGTNGSVRAAVQSNAVASGSAGWSQSAPTTLDLNTEQAYTPPATEQGSPSMAWNCDNSNHASMGQDGQDWYVSQGAP